MRRLAASLLLVSPVLLLAGCSTAQPPAPRPAPVALRPAAPRPAPPVVPSAAPVALRSVTPARGSALPERNVPLERVLERAAASNRPALLYFCAAWCGYCSKMNRETLSRPEVQAHLAQRFVAVEYDVDTPLGRELAQRYGARGYPTMVVVDAAGRATQTIVGAREPQAFLAMLGGSAP